MRNVFRPAASAAAFVVLTGLAACGGGGGGGSNEGAGNNTPRTPQPTQPLAAYVASGEGGIGSITINVGANGVFQADTSAVTLENTGASGCTATSTPADPDPNVCNRLADGKAYLFCSNTSGRNFDVVMFRQADVQTGVLSDVQGTTMAGMACGATGPRATGDTLAFSADGSTAIETFANGSTNNVGTSFPATLIGSPTGMQQTGSQHERWAVYKVAAGGGTQVFLLDLWQADNATTPDHPAAMYFLQK